MIEEQTLPRFEGVASSADCLPLSPGELPDMGILMAGRAFLQAAIEDEPQHLFIGVANSVAIQTTGPLVTTGETVVGPLMVELDAPPAVDPMTRQAVSLQHESVEPWLVRVSVTGTA